MYVLTSIMYVLTSIYFVYLRACTFEYLHVHPVVDFSFPSLFLPGLNVSSIYFNIVCVYVCVCECVREVRFCLRICGYVRACVQVRMKV